MSRNPSLPGDSQQILIASIPAKAHGVALVYTQGREQLVSTSQVQRRFHGEPGARSQRGVDTRSRQQSIAPTKRDPGRQQPPVMLGTKLHPGKRQHRDASQPHRRATHREHPHRAAIQREPRPRRLDGQRRPGARTRTQRHRAISLNGVFPGAAERQPICPQMSAPGLHPDAAFKRHLPGGKNDPLGPKMSVRKRIWRNDGRGLLWNFSHQPPDGATLEKPCSSLRATRSPATRGQRQEPHEEPAPRGVSSPRRDPAAAAAVILAGGAVRRGAHAALSRGSR